MTTSNVFFPTVGKSISCVQFKKEKVSDFVFVFVWATKRFPVHVREVKISNNITRLMWFCIANILKKVVKFVLRDTILAFGWRVVKTTDVTFTILNSYGDPKERFADC